jgi:maltose alpha-D-glucosyltransferase / alpha-amylase
MRRLLKLRKQFPVLALGNNQIIEEENLKILSILRTSGQEAFLAIHNLSGEEQISELDLGEWKQAKVYNVLKDQPGSSLSEDSWRVSLQPYEYLWLKLER